MYIHAYVCILGMLIPVCFGKQKTGFQLLKSGFKPVFGFTRLHRNLSFKPSSIL